MRPRSFSTAFTSSPKEKTSSWSRRKSKRHQNQMTVTRLWSASTERIFGLSTPSTSLQSNGLWPQSSPSKSTHNSTRPMARIFFFRVKGYNKHMFWQKQKGKKLFVGLSSGVDSAVSATLLQQQGYDVTGVFIRIVIDGYPCTAGEDKVDAMRVAAHLRIPFFTVDLSKEYTKRVFEVSVAEFAKGRTPNPDALCNREIKFGLFFDWCIAQGADFVATGHYAQVENEQGRTLLKMGGDPDKDQSYFLWAVPETKLRKTMFPVGGLAKPEVRRLARNFGLPNADRKDSQGLCFLGPVSIDEMLHRELRLVQGDVLDEAGAVLGKHEDVQAYTLG